ncbi:MAG: hypothetical protein CVU57_03030 [Deltaproteobacteria bacterium HGW-Deltaproteobacteria-15]|jgi:hypothetical protein|nr:MAG: hypothetical protein CVU57_03030 [Deltaproteobacteria bacterium HGW-Deltaproteobacteria-15]
MDNLRLVFSEDEKIFCVCTALVIKMNSLRAKFQGGPKAFAEKFDAVFNRDIAAVCSMDDQETDRYVKDLLDSGMVYKIDFAHIDAFCHGLIYSMNKAHCPQDNTGDAIKLEVDWLIGGMLDGGLWISLKPKSGHAGKGARG